MTGMLRTEAVAALAAARGSMLSVVTMQAIAPWVAMGQADDRNINLLGSMGSASTLGAGIALVRPDERVLVLDGDGSLLMQLGSLVSVAGLQLQNFFHVVFENGSYQTSGAQALPDQGRADLCAIALASGYADTVRYDSVDDTKNLADVLKGNGPMLISFTISAQGEVPPNDVPKPPDFGTQMGNMRSGLGVS
jgi:thiamine pyrophosphate-dependent acetolactate synthase large subunit-like protein